MTSNHNIDKQVALLAERLSRFDEALNHYPDLTQGLRGKIQESEWLNASALRAAVAEKAREGRELRVGIIGRVKAGKSSLLNRVAPGLSLATGKISDKIKRGRHTTRIAQLLPYAGGYVVDTPGFSSTELEKIEKNALAGYFPEFLPFLGRCRYNTCTHSHEPQCAVKQAVEEGEISSERYEAYLNILQEIAERKKDYE